METKKLLSVFIPAVLLAGAFLFIQVLRYEPQFPTETEKTTEFSVPVAADDPIVGLKRAGKIIVAFEDYSCPSCQEHDRVLTQVLAAHPSVVKVVWKGLPVTRFPYPSELAIKYGYCAQQQNRFTDFKSAALAISDQLSETNLKSIATNLKLDADKLTACLESDAVKAHLNNNQTTAQLLNIQSVPTFFVNNKQVTVAPTVEAWEEVLGITKK